MCVFLYYPLGLYPFLVLLIRWGGINFQIKAFFLTVFYSVESLVIEKTHHLQNEQPKCLLNRGGFKIYYNHIIIPTVSSWQKHSNTPKRKLTKKTPQPSHFFTSYLLQTSLIQWVLHSCTPPQHSRNFSLTEQSHSKCTHTMFILLSFFLNEVVFKHYFLVYFIFYLECFSTCYYRTL